MEQESIEIELPDSFPVKDRLARWGLLLMCLLLITIVVGFAFDRHLLIERLAGIDANVIATNLETMAKLENHEEVLSGICQYNGHPSISVCATAVK